MYVKCFEFAKKSTITESEIFTSCLCLTKYLERNIKKTLTSAFAWHLIPVAKALFWKECWGLGYLSIRIGGFSDIYTANIYLLKVNNRNTKKRCEICSKSAINTSERCHWRRSGVLLLTLNTCHPFSSVSISHFGQVNVSWAHILKVVNSWCNTLTMIYLLDIKSLFTWGKLNLY